MAHIREAWTDEEAIVMAAAAVTYLKRPTKRDLEDYLGLDIYVREDYITGGPGYTGPVWMIHWDGDPRYISVLTFHGKSIEWHDLGVKDDHPARKLTIDTTTCEWRDLVVAARRLLMEKAWDRIIHLKKVEDTPV